ncbi:hypothetical protein T12_13082 [Trichinella patagoniensis]|uniref:Uncharacterized protein n=1 Tax=Trichinella patagoniensis TaxID=990121 RepID=A0A0V0ZLC6_9BILA|nr:hypothetical protein T12_13082 [Trichinella patagoniensis]
MRSLFLLFFEPQFCDWRDREMHWKNEMELNDEKAPIQKSGILFHVIMQATWSRNVKQKCEIAKHGLPEIIVTQYGTSFVSQEN